MQSSLLKENKITCILFVQTFFFVVNGDSLTEFIVKSAINRLAVLQWSMYSIAGLRKSERGFLGQQVGIAVIIQWHITNCFLPLFVFPSYYRILCRIELVVYMPPSFQRGWLLSSVHQAKNSVLEVFILPNVQILSGAVTATGHHLVPPLLYSRSLFTLYLNLFGCSGMKEASQSSRTGSRRCTLSLQKYKNYCMNLSRGM